MSEASTENRPLTASGKMTAVAALFLASFGWALAPVFIRYLSHAYDPYSQMLLRYGTGALTLTAVCLVGFRAEFLRTLKQPRLIVPLAVVIVGHQYVWTLGNYGSTATVAQLTTKLSVILIVVFSFVLFHEERAVIRSPLYLMGTAMSLVGVAAVLAKDRASMMPVFDRYAVFLLLTGLLWSVYVVWAKHLVAGIHPVPLFTVLALWTTGGFVVLAVFLGDWRTVATAGPRMTVVAVASGLIPIATAHPAYHYAQKHLGAAMCSSLNLLNPLMTYAMALFIWPDERLQPTQWAGAAVLLIGTFLVTLAARKSNGATGQT